MPFEAGSFDAILSSDMLEHLAPAEIPGAARELARVAVVRQHRRRAEHEEVRRKKLRILDPRHALRTDALLECVKLPRGHAVREGGGLAAVYRDVAATARAQERADVLPGLLPEDSGHGID